MNNLESQLLEHYLNGVKMKDLIEMNKHINPVELQRIVNKTIGAYLQEA